MRSKSFTHHISKASLKSYVCLCGHFVLSASNYLMNRIMTRLEILRAQPERRKKKLEVWGEQREGWWATMHVERLVLYFLLLKWLCIFIYMVVRFSLCTETFLPEKIQYLSLSLDVGYIDRTTQICMFLHFLFCFIFSVICVLLDILCLFYVDSQLEFHWNHQKRAMTFGFECWEI